jgi:hypothetical protein
MLGAVLACEYRQDLDAADKGNGRCAFYYTLPPELPATTRASLRIQRLEGPGGIEMTQNCRTRLSQAA